MKPEERIKTLENELKLMKQEVKLTLVDVHNFLLGVDLPPSPDELFENMGSNEPGVKATPIDLSKSNEPASRKDSHTSERKERDSKESRTEVSKAGVSGRPAEVVAACKRPESASKKAEDIPAVGLLEEEPEDNMQQDEDEKKDTKELKEKGKSVLQVNMLANLIRWVSEAKRKIGVQQLETLLDVYAITGYLCPELKQVILHLSTTVATEPSREGEGSLYHLMIKDQLSRFLNVYCVNGKLSPELKDSILHLVDITAERQAEADKADVWSRLILELHGILSVEEAPIRSLKLSWGEEVEREEEKEEVEAKAEEEAQPEKCLKLRLALPVADGTEKEFSINLFPEAVEQFSARSSAGDNKA